MLEYTVTPDQVRISNENGEWFLDGFNTKTKEYTQMCWSYDNLKGAMENVADFVAATELVGVIWGE